jgi:RimJ/RimL family protein N-acetyltransferase
MARSNALNLTPQGVLPGRGAAGLRPAHRLRPHRTRLDGVKAGKLGYAIRADEWGNGYATDAARTMTDFGFRDLGLHRMSVTIGPDNAPSIAVAKRLGFQYEGRIRDHGYTGGASRDSLLYSLLEHEWADAERTPSDSETSLAG